MRRGFYLALALSLVVHLFVITAPGWQLSDILDDKEPPVLEARLVAPRTAQFETSAAPKKARPVKKTPRKHRVIPKLAPMPAVTNEQAAVDASAEQNESEASNSDTASATAAEPATESPVENRADSGAAGESVSSPGEASTAVNPDQNSAEVPVSEDVPDAVILLPKQGRIVYAVRRGEDGLVIGRSTHEWHHDGKRYSISATTETTGIAALFKSVKVVQTSEGAISKGDMKPDSFIYDRGENKVETAQFEWSAMQIKQGDGQVFLMSGGEKDVLSMFYQLTQIAQRDKSFILGVATGRKLQRYSFEWVDEEVVQLKSGPVTTWHVIVRAADGGKDTTEVWLGQQVAGLPVKIRNTDRKGGVFEQTAEDIVYEE